MLSREETMEWHFRRRPPPAGRRILSHSFPRLIHSCTRGHPRIPVCLGINVTMDATASSSVDPFDVAFGTLSLASDESSAAGSPSEHTNTTEPLPLLPPRPPSVPTLTELCIDTISSDFESVFRLPAALHLEEIPERACAPVALVSAPHHLK